MSKSVTISGTATVRFRKTITDMEEDEVRDLQEDYDLRCLQIGESDITDIDVIDECEVDVW